MSERKNVFCFRQFDVCQTHTAMKVGTDSDLLGALAPGGSRVLDVGTGTGVLALMMAQRFEKAQIVAVEIDEGAALDATFNFKSSPWADRLTLVHDSFEHFAEANGGKQLFDAVVCNPPYFENALECDDPGRRRARHASSLSFGALAEGVSRLLTPDGLFTVILPAEARAAFDSECVVRGLWLRRRVEIHTVAHKPAKRVVSVYSPRRIETPQIENRCLRDADNGCSLWYRELMSDFLLRIS